MALSLGLFSLSVLAYQPSVHDQEFAQMFTNKISSVIHARQLNTSLVIKKLQDFAHRFSQQNERFARIVNQVADYLVHTNLTGSNQENILDTDGSVRCQSNASEKNIEIRMQKEWQDPESPQKVYLQLHYNPIKVTQITTIPQNPNGFLFANAHCTIFSPFVLS
ncbi:MAG: hypothetical protein GXP45_04125 [bacterium]|nr:hypothetical protein [bacterium]